MAFGVGAVAVTGTVVPVLSSVLGGVNPAADDNGTGKAPTRYEEVNEINASSV